MLLDTLLRFALAGTLVVLFGAVGSALEPKTLAGIFGAAPSIALASLALAQARHGVAFVTLEARSMIGGAAALTAYGLGAAALVRRPGISPWLVTTALWALWLLVAGVAFGLLAR